MDISKLEYTICPVRDKILAEKFSETFKLRAVRYGMSVENNGGLSNPVPSGTECGDSHMAYLTARGKLVAVNFSTNILSRRDRKTGRSCPVRDKMSVENAGCTSNPVPSGTECDDCHIAYLTARGKLVAVHFSTSILSRRDRKTRRPTPVRDRKTGHPCPRRDKMPVEDETRSPTSRPVGTECDLPVLFPVPSRTGRRRWYERTFSSGILFPPGQRNRYVSFISRYLMINVGAPARGARVVSFQFSIKKSI